MKRQTVKRPALKQLAMLAAATTAVMTLGACGGDSDSATDGPGSVAGAPDVEADDTVPQECVTAFGYADPTADVANLTTAPSTWPAPPEGSVLCLTSSAGATQTASYAGDADIDVVFDHYSSAVPGLELVSGQENGTGYATLTGDVDGVGVEVREREGQTFVLAFAEAGAQ